MAARLDAAGRRAAESVIEVELLMARMVVPAGMPLPVIAWPATRLAVLAMPVMTADPLVSCR